MAWVAALTKLLPMLGALKGMKGSGGGGGGMGSSMMGPTPQTSGFMPNGQMVPQAWDPKTGQLAPVQQGPVGGSGGYAPGSLQTGGAMPQQGGGAEKQMGLLQLHDNLQKNMNGVAEGLKMFGHSLGGLDKTPLNNISRNQPPIIRPGDIQNPGVLGLAALMAKIAGGN